MTSDAPKWKKISQQIYQSSLKPTDMTEGQIGLLCKYYSLAHNYLEFGCGGSTYAALQFPNIRTIHSVESSKEWTEEVAKQPEAEEAIASGRLHMHHIDIGRIGDWGMPLHMFTMQRWAEYYCNVWSRIPEEIDCVLVDGRFRVACVLVSILLSKDHNLRILIHDFPDRPEYHIVLRYLEEIEYYEKLYVFTIRKDLSVKDVLIDLQGYLYAPRDNYSVLIPMKERLENNIILQDEHIEYLKREIRYNNINISKVVANYDTAQDMLIKANSELERVESELNDKKQEIADLQKTKNKLETDNYQSLDINKQLEIQITELQSHISELESYNEELTNHNKKLNDYNEELLILNSKLDAHVDELLAGHEELERKLIHSKKQTKKGIRERDQLLGKLAKEKQRRKDLMMTLSWRITKPFRYLGKVLEPMKHRK